MKRIQIGLFVVMLLNFFVGGILSAMVARAFGAPTSIEFLFAIHIANGIGDTIEGIGIGILIGLQIAKMALDKN